MNSHINRCRDQVQTACFSPLAFDGTLAPGHTQIYCHDEQTLRLNDAYQLRYDAEHQTFAFTSWEEDLYTYNTFSGIDLPASYPCSEQKGPSRFIQYDPLLPPRFVHSEWRWGDVQQRSFLFTTIEESLLTRDLGTAHKLFASLEPSDQCTPRALYLRGVMHIMTGQYQHAKHYFHRAASGGNVDAYAAEQQAFALLLSEYYANHPTVFAALQQHDWKGVLEELSLHDRNTTAGGVLMLRALREQRTMHSYEQIAQVGDRVFQSDVLLPDALIDYWNLLVACRKDYEALYLAQLLYQLYPLHVGTYRALTISNLVLERYEQAYAALGGLLLTPGQEQIFLETLAQYEEYSDTNGITQQLCEEGANRAPHCTALQLLHHRYVPVQENTSDPLERMAALDEHYQEEALLTHCDRLIAAGQELEALKLIRTALQLNPDNVCPLVVTRCSTLLRKYNHPELAYELWSFYGMPTVESTFSSGAKPLLEFACTLVEHGSEDEGLEHIQMLYALFPEERSVREVYNMLHQ